MRRTLTYFRSANNLLILNTLYSLVPNVKCLLILQMLLICIYRRFHAFLIFIVGEKNNYKRNLQDANKAISQLEESTNLLEKDAEELRASVREIENARQQARREIQQLHNQVCACAAMVILSQLLVLNCFYDCITFELIFLSDRFVLLIMIA